MRTVGPDLLGQFFERIIRTGFKQTKGQFFTHENIADFMVSVLDLPDWTVSRIKAGDRPPRMIDPALGSGTFLLKAMIRMTSACEEALAARVGLSEDARDRLDGIVNSRPLHRWVKDYLYGLEIHDDLGLAAQVNMLLHSDGSSAIAVGPARGNGLAPFSQYGSSQSILRRSGRRDDYAHAVNEAFDVVVTNPPFSVKYTDEQWKKLKQSFGLAVSRRSEDVFLERWYQLLRPLGRLACVVPNSMLDGRRSKARSFLLERFWVRLVVSLPADAFYPHTSTKTSLVFAQKKGKEEDSASVAVGVGVPDGVRFARAEYLGYRRTSRGETAHRTNDLDQVLEDLKEDKIWL